MAAQLAQTARFENATELAFEDISSERYREYRFGGGDVVRIEEPLINVSASGGHRIFDAEGVSHYIPAGWIHLSWVAKDGEPNFVK